MSADATAWPEQHSLLCASGMVQKCVLNSCRCMVVRLQLPVFDKTSSNATFHAAEGFGWQPALDFGGRRVEGLRLQPRSFGFMSPFQCQRAYLAERTAATPAYS